MKGSVNHFEIHVARPDVTIPFYKELLGYFEWQVLAEWPGGLGIGDGNVSLWFFGTEAGRPAQPYDRDGVGLGHFGIHVESAEAVRTFVSEFMEPRAIAPQFDTPRARPDFRESYFQVMFLDPEGLAVEVFHA